MELSYAIIEGSPQVSLINVSGRVDGSNYSLLVEKASELLVRGPGYLLLSLKGCEYLSSAGLFALHNIALIAHKLVPLDPEDGWGAIKNMANEKRHFKDRFKISNVPENIMNTLELAGLSSLYAIYPERQDALSAFYSIS